MANRMERRDFLKMQAAAAAGFVLTGASALSAYGQAAAPVRIGVIGTGGRGGGLLGLLLGFEGVEIPALCDINPTALASNQECVVKAGRKKPEGYSRDEYVYKEMLDRDDLDAVVIATPWKWHAPMAVDAMNRGKYAGIEVPCAITIEQCWDLVDTSEKTGVPCMMLENWSFRNDNLAVLNMIRKGLLGQIVHCHCAHSHDCIDHWFFDNATGQDKWPAEYLLTKNNDLYPTHDLGPVLSWMDINCGDRLDYLTSMATDPIGINDMFVRRFGPDHPSAKRKFTQGDIVTSSVRTKKGKTIVINYDMHLPRPYDNRWMIQGTRGLYDEARESVYIVDKSPQYHQWEPFAPYMKEHEHRWSKMAEGHGGHGGTDWLEISLFVNAVRNKTQTPIDVYDSVTMSAIFPLSGDSIAQGSAPVTVPDFTRGKWATRKPRFAVEA